METLREMYAALTETQLLNMCLLLVSCTVAYLLLEMILKYNKNKKYKEYNTDDRDEDIRI